MIKFISLILLLTSINIYSINKSDCIEVYKIYFGDKANAKIIEEFYIKCLALETLEYKSTLKLGKEIIARLKVEKHVVLKKYGLSLNNNLLIAASIILRSFRGKNKLFITSAFRNHIKQKNLIKLRYTGNKASKKSSHMTFSAIDFYVKGNYFRAKNRIRKIIQKYFPDSCLKIVEESRIKVVHIGLNFKCKKNKYFRKKVIRRLIQKRILKKDTSLYKNPSIYNFK